MAHAHCELYCRQWSICVQQQMTPRRASAQSCNRTDSSIEDLAFCRSGQLHCGPRRYPERQLQCQFLLSGHHGGFQERRFCRRRPLSANRPPRTCSLAAYRLELYHWVHIQPIPCSLPLGKNLRASPKARLRGTCSA